MLNVQFFSELLGKNLQNAKKICTFAVFFQKNHENDKARCEKHANITKEIALRSRTELLKLL
jgi:hypothetical protein